ncbi:uncharacterized protein LOC127841228 [Dreissena polymorpha]|uniref:uncharacterized protein LOC127841228 n=1 Tax=Dreissena polymorpha TaxID=45954 RepID=UPI002265375C|nr:uncharacterized protein LOC127841228 [Dreissena polymorpha]
MSQARHASYSDLTNPALQHAINQNCLSTIHLARLVSEFAQEMASSYESFAKDIQRVVAMFRDRSNTLKSERSLDTPSSLYSVWENLLKETELDAQAHLDASGLLLKNVSEPLQEVSKYKMSQALKLQTFRQNFEDILQHSEESFNKKEEAYRETYKAFKTCGSLDNREGLKHTFHSAHNEYLLQLRASNRLQDDMKVTLPQVLEELDEICIDTTNTVNVAIESHSLLLLTKANEQRRQLENLLRCCRQVNPMLDISLFVKAINSEEHKIPLQRHKFSPADPMANSGEDSLMNHLIIDRVTEGALLDKRSGLQKEALELTSYIKQNQDVTQALVNMCQRNLAHHLYAKVYETQEDLCRKRNEIRVANLQLGMVRAQIELLSPKQNGAPEDEQEKKNPSTIRGMWKKAFKTLKSSSSVEKLSKKSSFSKKKQNSKEADEEVEQLNSPVDPVYSLLKCAADLPRSGGKSPCLLHAHCSGQHTPSNPGNARYPSGGDSSGNTSKASSPSSSASHSPKTRRKKLNVRMKSFSLDTPEPPKQLLAIDENTKKKSTSFTNTCFGGKESPEDRMSFSASSLRKKFALAKASSLETEEKKNCSLSPSPKCSPKSQRKDAKSLYVALYNFKAKEKDDMDLRAGWRVTVTESSKKHWWKGKTHGRSGYFPATYVIPLQSDQRVFQVLQAINLSDGQYSIKFHKDQIVLQIGEAMEGMILVRAANNRQALCPLQYLQEL